MPRPPAPEPQCTRVLNRFSADWAAKWSMPSTLSAARCPPACAIRRSVPPIPPYQPPTTRHVNDEPEPSAPQSRPGVVVEVVLVRHQRVVAHCPGCPAVTATPPSGGIGMIQDFALVADALLAAGSRPEGGRGGQRNARAHDPALGIAHARSRGDCSPPPACPETTAADGHALPGWTVGVSSLGLWPQWCLNEREKWLASGWCGPARDVPPREYDVRWCAGKSGRRE